METRLIDFVSKEASLGGFVCDEKVNSLSRVVIFNYNGENYQLVTTPNSKGAYALDKSPLPFLRNGFTEPVKCEVSYENNNNQEYIKFFIREENGCTREILRIGIGKDYKGRYGCICEYSWQNMPREDEDICSTGCEFYKAEYGEGFCRREETLPKFCRCEGDKTQCEHPENESACVPAKKEKTIAQGIRKAADNDWEKVLKEVQKHLIVNKYSARNEGEMELFKMGYKCIGKDKWLCADQDNSSQITMSGQWAIINENGNNQVKITYGEAKAIVKLFEERMKKDV